MTDRPHGARFVHTNVVAKDWRSLARDYAGPELERGAGVPGAALRGALAGGTAVGDVVTLTTAGGRRVTWCYMRDPVGNIVELQAWAGSGSR